MNANLLNKLVNRSFDLLDLVEHKKNKHFSFIVRKNKVLSLGWNIIGKTHTLSWKYKYSWNFLHSELHAIKNFQDVPAMLGRCDLVNIRISKKGKLAIAKPCDECLRMLASFDFKDVFYTDNSGLFQKL